MSKESISQWRPIETAPKDGTQVDVYTDVFGRVPNAVFANNEWRHVSINDFDRLGYVPIGVEVTHWMPIPGPPESEVSL